MNRSSSEPQPAAERAYDFAKWAILTAVYRGGELITEAGLAHEIGVGRRPVRDALRRLDREGLVRLDGHGAVVAEFSLCEVEDVFEARALIENHTAGRSFGQRATLLPVVEQAHAAMVKSARERDTAGFTAAERNFHEAIVDAAGSPVLSSLYGRLRDRQTLFTSMLVRDRPDRMAATIEEHERILDNLRGDDEEAFRAGVKDHLDWSAAIAREPR